MTERGFHPFAVLHFLRKTILLYLLPLLQVLFARNWAALRTALVQGAALLTVLAAVSAAVLHAGRWRVDAQGTLRVRWRLGVRLDRCLKASQLAALTIASRPATPLHIPYTMSAPRLLQLSNTPARLALMTEVGPPD